MHIIYSLLLIIMESRLEELKMNHRFIHYVHYVHYGLFDVIDSSYLFSVFLSVCF
jgi:hypothetical protein